MTYIIFIFIWLVSGLTCQAASTISIGSKKFTESYVLSEIAKAQLEQKGFSISHRQGMGGTVIVWQALLHGDIAVYPDYTGTIAQEILKLDAKTPLDALRDALEKQGIGVTASLGFDNSYALATTDNLAQKLNLKTIDDLRNYPGLRAGPTPEFWARKDGWQPLVTTYGLQFRDVRNIEHGLGYAALSRGEMDVKDCYTTDAKIGEYHLTTLKDDQHFFPQYQAVFLYRLDFPPEAVRVLRELEGKIDTTKMIALNGIAEKTGDYALAARAFLSNDLNVVEAKGSWLLNWFKPIPRLTFQHLTLVVISLLLAIVISIPLGVIASKGGFAGRLILETASVIQTIPSLALLALLIPLFGIGQQPAIMALFLYSLLPIIRNTAVGLQNVSLSICQAAEALGLESYDRLRLIDLPIAAPLILAGIKTSAVLNVGNATLAGLIGGGGYGEAIQSGLQLNDNATILQGAIPAACLAIAVQYAFTLTERIVVSEGLRKRDQRYSST